MYLGDVGITSCQILLTDLFVKTYSTSINSHTIALTNTLTTGINNAIKENLEISLFANEIRTNSADQLYLKIFDLTGKQVLNISFSESIKLDLNKGLYIIRVFSQSNELIRCKRILITE